MAHSPGLARTVITVPTSHFKPNPPWKLQLQSCIIIFLVYMVDVSVMVTFISKQS